MVRRNMYSLVNPITNTLIADKFELSSNVTETSYVGWHTALEFHGMAHQPFYNAYVGSLNRFKPFSFEDIDYEYCSTGIEPTEENGIIRPSGNAYVRVTDLERTVVDCCDRIDLTGGIEELLHSMESITLLKEDLLKRYLQTYDKTFLYQKTGYILERNKDHINISESFIEMCHNKGAIHTQRLSNTELSDSYVCRWKLYVPKNCLTTGNNDYELI